MMTRKHFEAIAKALKDSRPLSGTQGQRNTWEQCAVNLAGVCREGNPRFDTARFLEACGAHEGWRTGVPS